jgi:serine/threonine protein kinase
MNFCTQCLYPYNLDDARFCVKCGSTLLLKDRYRVLSPIGQGGFGRTFLAVDEHIPSKPQCVIKHLHLHQHSDSVGSKAMELFVQEAVRLDQLRHPQIPQLLAHFEQENQLYLVQEFIQGETLEQELKHQGVYNEAKIRQLLKDLLPVLEFIHSRQVIHRDIKPSNIMRRQPGGEVVLIDFGVAKYLTSTVLVKTGTTVGSPEYMPPEQTRGKVLPASDLYSFGVTCIYLLTGISPFDLFDVTSDRWIWRDYLPYNNPISGDLGEIIDKLIQNPLPRRYKSATEVIAALTPKPKPIAPQPINKLYSSTGIDYKQLNNLLAVQKWQQANQLTWDLMCQALSKPLGSYFFIKDIENMPCEDLRIIDELWAKYSNGKFGFSSQVKIYNICDCDYGQFCAAVGWNLSKSSSLTQALSFRLSAPAGHLPSHFWSGGTQLWRHLSALDTKLKSCYNR